MVDLNNLTGIVSTPSEITGMIEAVTGSRLKSTGTFSASDDARLVEVHTVPFRPKIILIYPNTTNLALSGISSASKFFLLLSVSGPDYHWNFYGYRTSTSLSSTSFRRSTSGAVIDIFDNGFGIKFTGNNYCFFDREYSYAAFA